MSTSRPETTTRAPQAWATREELTAARLRFEALMPGYRAPAVYGTVVHHADGTTEVGAANRGEHGLPAAVMSLLVGWDGVTRTLELPGALLARAAELLEPAEAARDLEHPNLRSWRRTLAHLAGHPGCRALVVLVADERDAPTSPYDVLVREQVAHRSA
ncbi:hypothetical protein V5D56_13160 [Cellulosimicrobium sp. PMB13]|uniref:hypothetical protein n=1 Tax=Cellulosimicrobium sp. PMB13 TaxID=3120158 RepID=UPI003F4C55D0